MLSNFFHFGTILRVIAIHIEKLYNIVFLTPSQGLHEIPNNEAFASKVGDTLPEDTGGQGGHTQPPPPPRP